MKPNEIDNGKMEKNGRLPAQCPGQVHFSPDAGAEEDAALVDLDGDDSAGEDSVIVGDSIVGA